MRVMTMLVGTLLAGAYVGTAAWAQDTSSLAGTWNVTSTESHGTCSSNAGSVTAYVWIVSTKADGTVSVDVQGTTSFPALTGSWDSGSNTLTVQGDYKDPSKLPTSWFRLRMEDGKLVGVRRLLSTVKKRTPGQYRACFTDFDLKATR